MTSPLQRWSPPLQALHWIMAALILSQFALGWIAWSWRLSPTKLSLLMWHKSFGLVILALALARLAWRWFDAAPPPPHGYGDTERRVRALAIALLYGAMLATPLSGWVLSSAAGIPFRMFGAIPVPDLVAASKPLKEAARAAHLYLFWAFAALLVLHIGNALYHQFVRRDGLLLRMLPPPRTERRNGEESR